MKRRKLIISLVCMCVFLAVSVITGPAQDKNENPVKAEDFVPSPVFSPPYPSLPHHFTDIHTIQILCKAPKGAIKRALAPPLEPVGDGDTFILLQAGSRDLESQKLRDQKSVSHSAAPTAESSALFMPGPAQDSGGDRSYRADNPPSPKASGAACR